MADHHYNSWNIDIDHDVMDRYDEIKALLVKKGEDGREHVSFKMLVPIPEMFARSYNHYSGNEKVLMLQEKDGARRRATKEEVSHLFRTTGHTDAVSWATENWGTKGDAFDSDIYEDQVGDCFRLVFYTQWVAPMPIIDRFMKKIEEMGLKGKVRLTYEDTRIEYITVD